MKRSLLITAILGAVAVAIYLFAVEPTEGKLKQKRLELEEAKSRHEAMMRNLSSADQTDKRIANCETNLAPFRAAMLTPLLESYAMRAKSLVDPLATGAGLTELNYEELPPIALPTPKRLPKQLHARRPIKITASGSYQSAVSFLMRLEKEFPLVILQALSINAGHGPVLQRIEFILEWPALGQKTVIEKGAQK